MNKNNLRIILNICVCSALLFGGTTMNSCGRCGNKNDTEQPKSETFISSQPENTANQQENQVATPENKAANGQYAPENTNTDKTGTPPTSTDSPQRKPTNDNDPNLHGYKYKYDKQTSYEDGIFSDTPDYIAIPAKIHGKPEQILFRKTYALSYNNLTKQANWAAWHLTKPHTYGHGERPQRAFHDDEDVSNSTHYYDYNRSKTYERGHLCPAGDNKWDEDAMYETFLMTNVCPQHYDLNSGVWNDIEMKCRDWARQEGDVYIVCGPIFYPHRRNRELIGKSRIPVPDAFFKVVLSNKHQGKGIGFICENRHGSSNLNDYMMTIDEVERITGIDFFPAIPDDMENRVESQIGRFR